MRKRWISMALALVMALSLLPFGALAAEIVKSGSFGSRITWTLSSDGLLTISGEGEMPYLERPPFMDAGIADDIEKAVIAPGVTSLGAFTFYGCGNLTSVSIPDGVTAIGDHAFDSCSSLPDITIPGSVASIGENAFIDCTRLQSVTFPDGITSIGNGAFVRCTGLTSIVLPDSVTSIGGYAFSGCAGLQSVTLPAGLTILRSDTFRHCASLAEITIPDGVTTIGASAFSDCTSLRSAAIPDSVTTVESYAFSGCTGLERITIPEGTTRIGEYAFSGCTGLTEAVISGGAIEAHAFDGCANLADVALSEPVTTIGEAAFSGCVKLREITIPESVTSIGGHAFSDCVGLTDATIPASAAVIGRGAFSGCTGLQRITIPGEATRIGWYAFNGCTGLTDASISGGVIGTCAFNGCTNLTDVTISDRVTELEESAFDGCTGLTRIIIPGESTKIGKNAFRGCTHLERADVSGALVGEAAFSGCTRLTSIHVAADVIGVSAFAGCRNLTSATLCNGISSIEASAFSGCTKLPELSLPPSVTTVEKDAFRDCISLKLVSIENKNLCLEDVFLSERVEDVLFAGSEETWLENGNRYSGLPDAARYHYNVTDFDHHFYSLHAAPTCTMDGCDLDTCDCGYEIRKIVFAATGHQTALTGKQDASCTGEGYTGDEVCTVCGEITKTGEVIPARGHQWNDGVVTKQPTETEEGIKTFTCAVCGSTKTESVPKKPAPKPDPAPTPTPTPSAEPEAKNPFKDVAKEQYYYAPVLWAVNHEPQITAGTSKTAFSPAATCTRGQVVTFLWRAAGCPEPKTTKNPFQDVKSSDYFYKAVLWAAENDITAGTSKTAFSPGAACTRAHVVTFLWRALGAHAVVMAESSNPTVYITASGNGKAYHRSTCSTLQNSKIVGISLSEAKERGLTPCKRCKPDSSPSSSESSPAPSPKPTPTPAPKPTPTPTPAPKRETVAGFGDVYADDYFAEAVRWAVNRGVTQGTSATAFSPAKPCTRGQIVTFLYRAMSEAE